MKRALAGVVAAVAAVAVMSGSAGAASGPNSVELRQTSPTGKITVVSVGVINAVGRDVPLSDTTDKFVYPEGNIFVSHKALDSDDSFKKDDCVTRHEESGTYKVTGGTGDYRGAEGGGTYEARFVSVGCGKHPERFLFTVSASGRLDIDNNG